jgi:monoamine oxidase
LSQEALLEVLLPGLEPVIGLWQGAPERVVTTDWMGDAYAGGGWLVYPLPSNDDLRTILGEPHGQCFFAGEHVATEDGTTMEGALRSGDEVARMLLARRAG